MRKRNKLGIRYLIFFTGLILVSFGIAIIAKSQLGNTPISSIPYTLSLIFPRFTLGNFTIMINFLFIALQGILLRRNAHAFDILLQIPIVLLFGYVIDFFMWTMRNLDPQNYGVKLAVLLIGCLALALGAYLEVVGDVAMLPADGLTNAIAKVSGKKFSTIKLITDSTQAVIALVLGLTILHTTGGVREGTIIGALLVGNIVKVYARFLKLDERLGLNVPAAEEAIG